MGFLEKTCFCALNKGGFDGLKIVAKFFSFLKLNCKQKPFERTLLLFVSLSGEVNFSKVARNSLEIVIFDLSYSFLEPRKVSKKNLAFSEDLHALFSLMFSLRAIWS